MLNFESFSAIKKNFCKAWMKITHKKYNLTIDLLFKYNNKGGI